MKRNKLKKLKKKHKEKKNKFSNWGLMNEKQKKLQEEGKCPNINVNFEQTISK